MNIPPAQYSDGRGSYAYIHYSLRIGELMKMEMKFKCHVKPRVFITVYTRNIFAGIFSTTSWSVTLWSSGDKKIRLTPPPPLFTPSDTLGNIVQLWIKVQLRSHSRASIIAKLWLLLVVVGGTCESQVRGVLGMKSHCMAQLWQALAPRSLMRSLHGNLWPI